MYVGDVEILAALREDGRSPLETEMLPGRTSVKFCNDMPMLFL
jgi:hypothetical protein